MLCGLRSCTLNKVHDLIQESAVIQHGSKVRDVANLDLGLLWGEYTEVEGERSNAVSELQGALQLVLILQYIMRQE